MMKSMTTVLAFLFAVSAAGTVAHAAEDVKIATVDLQKALQSVDAGKKAKAQLEKEFNTKSKEFQAERNSLTKAIEEFRKQSLALSEEARTKKQNEIQERGMKLQEATQRSQTELQQKEHDLTAPILTKLRGIITDLAKQKGYSMVLEKSDTTVIYSLDKDDLTDGVIDAFNKANKG
jgi:outer membrane protein